MKSSGAVRKTRALKEQGRPATKKIQIERFSIVASRPFDEVITHIKKSIGLPNTAELLTAIRQTKSIAEMESTVQKALGSAQLMLFFEFDHGDIVRKGSGRETPRIVRFLIGNPLIMKQMARHVPDAGAYAPVTVLVDERDDGVHISYDRMTSLLAPYGNPEALEVARSLDLKVEGLLQQAAGTTRAD